jgi:malonate transporter and related proteins
MFTSITVLMEVSRGTRGELRRLPWKLVTSVLGNPIIVGLGAGVVANRAGLTLPPIVDGFTEMLGRAAIPCALFATGAALRAFSIRGALPRATMLLVLKGAVHPLLVWLVCSRLLDLDPLWTAVAVVLAAMPVGVNPHLFAARYGVAEAETATAVALSTPLAVVTVTLALWAVGVP